MEDRELNISIGSSRWSTSWPVSSMTWTEFCGRLEKPIRGTESLGDFLKMPKAEQDNRKDVGGFVGGVVEGGRRKAGNVRSRDLITLDLDNIPEGGAETVLASVQMLGCAAAVYSTRKHRPAAPRLRIIIPADRTMSAEEYEPVCRRVAKLIGIDYCDPTTFELNRLMFWPSISKDGEYVCRKYGDKFLRVDSILGMYGDWRDVSQWPTAEGEKAAAKRLLAKQQDPTTKPGIVGAFCRTYTIREAMETFIPGMYTQAQSEDRYTYTGGTTSGGAIIYDGDRWLYSHHATDPCGGQLVNAFDLVRLHMFGDKDGDAKPDTPANRLPSFQAMQKLAFNDKSVSKLLAKERQEEASEAFAGIEISAAEGSSADGGDNWKERLTVTQNGTYQKTINNLVLILTHDPNLKGKIVTDEFAGCGLAIGPLPWDPGNKRHRWTDTDDAGVLWYMETYYGIPSKDKLLAALAIVGEQNKINEVRDYLFSLKWDGVHRLDTLYTDYLGAEDNVYTRAVSRKFRVAAVARAVEGGIKFDSMPITAGRQGLGKSTLENTMSGPWFSDSLTSFEGREAAEMLQGTWINEIGELSAMSKYEVAAVKQFLSKRSDIYRAAYGRRTEEHPRRCVFVGTSNDTEFLKDFTGNRRFWPIDVGVIEPKLSVFNDLPKWRDQIWAEAVMYWRMGEPLYLTGEALRISQEVQEAHREASDWEGLIQDFLERKVPWNWDTLGIPERKMFLNGNSRSAEPLAPIDKVCVLEIWTECLGGDPRYIRPQDRAKIGYILARMPGWSKIKTSARFGPYGTQRGFRKH